MTDLEASNDAAPKATHEPGKSRTNTYILVGSIVVVLLTLGLGLGFGLTENTMSAAPLDGDLDPGYENEMAQTDVPSSDDDDDDDDTNTTTTSTNNTNYMERYIEVCTVTDDQFCDYQYLLTNLPQGKKQWWVQPSATLDHTSCIDGSPYGFGVFLPPSASASASSEETTASPTPTTTTKLMIWFTGGGACYDYETCFEPGSTSAQTAVIPETQGYFNYELGPARNPLVYGNYAAVTIGYCSGDMHIGNAHVVVVSQQDPTQQETVRFNGFNNTMSVLNWIERQPELVLSTAAEGTQSTSASDNITSNKNIDSNSDSNTDTGGVVEIAAAGCSAGSLGVQMWSNYLVRRFGVGKIQPDSYVGMLPPSANTVLNLWNACTMAGVIGMNDELVRRCKCNGNGEGMEANEDDCLHSMPPLFEDFLTQNPTIPVAYTGSAHDIIQRGYYALLTTVSSEDDNNNDEFSTPATGGNNAMMENKKNASFVYASAVFPTYLMESMDVFSRTGTRVSNYIVDTIEHCFVNRDSTFLSTDGGRKGDRTVSKHAQCLDDTTEDAHDDDGDCQHLEDMAHFVSKFLNDDVYNGTPQYPDSYPPSWHLSCADSANTMQRIACNNCDVSNSSDVENGSATNSGVRRPNILPFSSTHDDQSSNEGQIGSTSASSSSASACFPLSEMDNEVPSKKQLDWLGSEDATEWFEEYIAGFNE